MVFRSGSLAEKQPTDGSDTFIYDPLDTTRGETVDGLDPKEKTPRAEDIAVVPFACRSLAFDGELFWSNYRAKDKIVSFVLPN